MVDSGPTYVFVRARQTHGTYRAEASDFFMSAGPDELLAAADAAFFAVNRFMLSSSVISHTYLLVLSLIHI